MQFRRCKCGEARRWDSGYPPKDCQGCTKCGTTLAQHPDDHQPLQPHKPKQFFSRETGQPEGWECAACRQQVEAPPQAETDRVYDRCEGCGRSVFCQEDFWSDDEGVVLCPECSPKEGER